MTTPLNKFVTYDTAGAPHLLTAVSTSTANAIPTLDGSGLIPTNMLPALAGATSITVFVGAAGVTAGDLVTLSNSAVHPTADRADATTLSGQAHGYVLETKTVGQTTLAYLGGIDTSIVGGGEAGVGLFLSDANPGQVVLAAGIPTVAGHIVQKVGYGAGITGALALMLNIETPTVLGA
jgi:hypothetical protein